MSSNKTDARCPDCDYPATVLSPKRLARHKDYRKSVRGVYPWCAQRTDPTAVIASAETERTRQGLRDATEQAVRHAESCERRYLEEKRWHDSAQAKLAAAREALAAFEREHPPQKTGATDDVRAVATFPHAAEGDDES